MPAAAVDKRQRIMQIREVMTVLFLAVMGWKDWKKKEISLLLTGTYGIIGLAFSIYAERPLEDWLLPFGVSLMILAVSVLTGGEIGLGDGWIVRYHGLAVSFADGAPRACRADQATRFTLVDAGAMAAPNGQVVHIREAIESAINRLEKFLAQ